MDFSNFIVENPPTPTYFSHKANPSTLDIILTNNLHQTCQVTAHQALSSDHLHLCRLKYLYPVFQQLLIFLNCLDMTI